MSEILLAGLANSPFKQSASTFTTNVWQNLTNDLLFLFPLLFF